MFEHPLTRTTGLACLIFVAMIGLGIFAVGHDPTVGAEVMDLFREQVAAGIMSDSPAVLAGKIFLNNLVTCTLLFLGGASFGVFTMLILMMNGVVIGAMTEIVRQQLGTLFIAAALIPHGIFEIPAFLIAGGLGLLLGRELINEWYGAGDAAAAAASLTRIFVRVVVPLLLVAAVVEAFITPVIISIMA